MYILIIAITLIVVFPFIWMLILSFRSSAEIMTNPLALPESLNLENYINASKTLDFIRLYGNTIFVCVVSLIIELVITFFSSFVLSRDGVQKQKDPVHAVWIFNHWIVTS